MYQYEVYIVIYIYIMLLDFRPISYCEVGRSTFIMYGNILYNLDLYNSYARFAQLFDFIRGDIYYSYYVLLDSII